MSESGQSFEDFVRTSSSALIGAAWLVSGDHGEAEDIVQTVLVRIGARWGSVSALANPSAYCRKAVLNEALSWRRKRRAVPVSTFLDAPDPSTAIPDQVAGERNALTLLAMLPVGQRAVMVLRYVYDLTEAQTAAELGVRLGTVKSQSSRALRTLRSSTPLQQGDLDARSVRA